MQLGALAPYEQALVSGQPLQLRHPRGATTTLDIGRWRAPADGVDLEIVTRAVAPVLDVGCGPGRILAALRALGRSALGVEIAPRAVQMSRDQGLNVLQRSVFAALPSEGKWRSIILLDGNIGIGGDVATLLRRCRELLAADGVVLVETDPDDTVHRAESVRFAINDEAVGPSFPWSIVGLNAMRCAALDAGLEVESAWQVQGRRFAQLTAR